MGNHALQQEIFDQLKRSNIRPLKIIKKENKRMLFICKQAYKLVDIKQKLLMGVGSIWPFFNLLSHKKHYLENERTECCNDRGIRHLPLQHVIFSGNKIAFFPDERLLDLVYKSRLSHPR
ncbi:Uncharacterised protein [Mycobacteroides abscessus subsp. abscessus]|nr:Uncharacterised protein [Mycobacteroides abscessus subsp. abscessus]